MKSGVVTRINPCNGRAIIRLQHGQLVAVDTQHDLEARDELHGDFTQPGGVLIRDASGALIGAVGISGDVSDKDEACAVAGIEAAGLAADTGA